MTMTDDDDDKAMMMMMLMLMLMLMTMMLLMMTTTLMMVSTIAWSLVLQEQRSRSCTPWEVPETRPACGDSTPRKARTVPAESATCIRIVTCRV